MKKKISVALLSVTFILIAGLLFFGLYRVFSWKDTTGEYHSSLRELKTLPKNSVDMVAVGPSLTYNSVNPAIIWDTNGIAAFDMAVSGMDQTSSYYHIKELLKTQSPKVIFIESSQLTTKEYAVLGNRYRNTIVMDPSKNSIHLAKELAPEGDTWNYLLRWPIIHSRYKELAKGDFVISAIDKYNLGYGFTAESHEQIMDMSIYHDTEKSELDDATKNYIDKLCTLSEEYGFEIVFFSVPQIMTIPKHKYLNGAKEYLDERGITYLDMLDYEDSLNFDEKTDFVDTTHMNTFGSKKFSTWLSNYAKEQFLLTDHRGDTKYSRWDECSKFYAQQMKDYLIENTQGYQIYIDQVLDSENILVIIADRNGSSVYLNGSPIYTFEGISNEFTYKLNSSEYLYMAVNPGIEGVETTAYVGSVRYIAPETTQMAILSYDLITEKLVDVRYY